MLEQPDFASHPRAGASSRHACPGGAIGAGAKSAGQPLASRRQRRFVCYSFDDGANRAVERKLLS